MIWPFAFALGLLSTALPFSLFIILLASLWLLKQDKHTLTQGLCTCCSFPCMLFLGFVHKLAVSKILSSTALSETSNSFLLTEFIGVWHCNTHYAYSLPAVWESRHFISVVNPEFPSPTVRRHTTVSSNLFFFFWIDVWVSREGDFCVFLDACWHRVHNNAFINFPNKYFLHPLMTQAYALSGVGKNE